MKETRSTVEKALREGGYNWIEWNDNGTEMTAIMTSSGVAVSCIKYQFTKGGKLISERKVK